MYVCMYIYIYIRMPKFVIAPVKGFCLVREKVPKI